MARTYNRRSAELDPPAINHAPVLDGLSGDAVTFIEDGAPVRIDLGGNAMVTETDINGFEAVLVGTGLGGPVHIAPFPGQPDRVFVVEQVGRVTILDTVTGLKTTFLDLTAEVGTIDEEGLSGFTTAPDFATSGTFYVFLIRPNDDIEIRRYNTTGGNHDVVDLSSMMPVLTIPHPDSTHHFGGWIAFGPDGNFYVATGDGSPFADIYGHAQDTNSLLGKMLRIDVGGDDFPGDPARNYAIPLDNPFAGGGGAPEVWAIGLRNPYRNSFDPVTGNLFIGDVGQGEMEEVDVMTPTMGGANFGWSVREGIQAFPNGPAGGVGPGPYVEPALAYRHDSSPGGVAVIGGYVYRGPIESLQGQYIFGDLTGSLWSVPVDALTSGTTLDETALRELGTAFMPQGGTIGLIAGFGLDSAGNFYIGDFSDGEIYRVQPAASANFAGGVLSVAITQNLVAAEDVLGFDTAPASTVTLSNGTQAGSHISVGGVVIGAIAANGTGAIGEALIVDLSSAATPERISTLIHAITYANALTTDPTSGPRTITFTLRDGAGTANGGTDTVIATTIVTVEEAHSDDLLLGTPANDTLRGGFGNDTYVVNHAGDVVIEAAGQGFDIVFSSVDYTLGAGSGVQVLSARFWEDTNALELTGNEIVNTLIGNAGNNRLHGGGGNDILNGREGDDVLFGDAGVDTMNGGQGNDIYVVEESGDAVFENAGEGTADVIFSAVSYTLPEGREIEVLSARFWEDTTALSLTGSSTANILIGNAGDNILDGAGGNDTMSGREGNDIYVVDGPGDAVNELAGQGMDVVFASVSYALIAGSDVEVLSSRFWESTNTLSLGGNDLDNTIYGNAGINFIDGAGGDDTLVGFGGADSFLFSTTLGLGNIDLIADFSGADDTIVLNRSVFTTLSVGPLGANAFVNGTTPQDADDRILYDAATGALFYDADGSGAGNSMLFAVLQGAPIISASDFTVI